MLMLINNLLFFKDVEYQGSSQYLKLTIFKGKPVMAADYCIITTLFSQFGEEGVYHFLGVYFFSVSVLLFLFE